MLASGDFGYGVELEKLKNAGYNILQAYNSGTADILMMGIGSKLFEWRDLLFGASTILCFSNLPMGGDDVANLFKAKEFSEVIKMTEAGCSVKFSSAANATSAMDLFRGYVRTAIFLSCYSPFVQINDQLCKSPDVAVAPPVSKNERWKILAKDLVSLHNLPATVEMKLVGRTVVDHPLIFPKAERHVVSSVANVFNDLCAQES